MRKEKTHVDWDTMVHVQEMANLRAENTRLREALEPFAALWQKRMERLYDAYPVYATDDGDEVHEVTVGDIRAARTALEAE